jgi:hypothetical protein
MPALGATYPDYLEAKDRAELARERRLFLMAISALGVCGRHVFGPLFDWVVSASNQESFVGLILTTVLGMSFLSYQVMGTWIYILLVFVGG